MSTELARLRELREWLGEREHDRDGDLESRYEQAEATGDYRAADARSNEINEERASDLAVLLSAVGNYLTTLEG